jgi:hypothetical protein
MVNTSTQDKVFDLPQYLRLVAPAPDPTILDETARSSSRSMPTGGPVRQRM